MISQFTEALGNMRAAPRTTAYPPMRQMVSFERSRFPS